MGRPEGVDTHFTRDFPHAPCTCDHTHIVAQGVSGAESLHPHAIHDVTCLSVRCWSSFGLPSLHLSLVPFLFHCLPVLCLAQLPQCRHRRGLKPLHSRTMRSIAPWRFSILSQKGGVRRAGAQHVALFSFSRLFCFPSQGVCLWNCGRSWPSHSARLGFSGVILCQARPKGRREPKRALCGPWPRSTATIPRADPREGKQIQFSGGNKRTEVWAVRGKDSPGEGGNRESEPSQFGPQLVNTCDGF